jgi:hypothetical protein
MSLIAWAYKEGAADAFKYGCIMATTIGIVLCCIAISRSLTHARLSIWQLQSVKTTLIIGLIEGLFAGVYAYVLYSTSAIDSPVRDALLQYPVIYAICTCILISYIYLVAREERMMSYL